MIRTTPIYLSLFICGLFVLASCTKEEVQHTNSNNSGGTIQFPKIFTLEASNWIKESAYAYYGCNFNNVLPDTKLRHGVSIGTFLLDDGKEIPLNQSVSFLNGLLWCNSAGTTLKLFYVCGNSGDRLPFNNLNIKVVIQ